MVKDVLRCPVCSSRLLSTTPARVGDYFRYKFGVTEAESHLCQLCEHVFSTPFIPDEQLNTYYQGYMTPGWMAERAAVEPWFAPYIEDRRNGNYHLERMRHYELNVDFQNRFKRIIDFGGGDGALAREVFPGAEITVVDVDTSAADVRTADLVFAAQVFEHLPNPRDVLQELTAPLSIGASVYIEVPIDFQRSMRDSFEACVRVQQATGQVADHALVLLHEHLGHFSRKSLKRLMQLSGLEVTGFYFSPTVFGAIGIRAE